MLYAWSVLGEKRKIDRTNNMKNDYETFLVFHSSFKTFFYHTQLFDNIQICIHFMIYFFYLIGIDFKIRTIELDGKKIKLQVKLLLKVIILIFLMYFNYI